MKMEIRKMVIEDLQIAFLFPNFLVRKKLTSEASASLNSKVGAFNTGENTSNPIRIPKQKLRNE